MAYSYDRVTLIPRASKAKAEADQLENRTTNSSITNSLKKNREEDEPSTSCRLRADVSIRRFLAIAMELMNPNWMSSSRSCSSSSHGRSRDKSLRLMKLLKTISLWIFLVS